MGFTFRRKNPSAHHPTSFFHTIGFHFHSLMKTKWSNSFMDILLDSECWLELIPKSRIRTVLDIGAKIGVLSLAARIRFPHSSTHAYEPNVEVKPNPDHQISTFDFTAIYDAVEIKDGRESLVANPGCDTSARVNPPDGGKLNHQLIQGDGQI